MWAPSINFDPTVFITHYMGYYKNGLNIPKSEILSQKFSIVSLALSVCNHGIISGALDLVDAHTIIFVYLKIKKIRGSLIVTAPGVFASKISNFITYDV